MRLTRVVRQAVPVLDLSQGATRYHESRLRQFAAAGSASTATGGRPSRTVIGIDVGTRHIGIALSDPYARIAFPLQGFRRRELRHDVEHIQRIVADAGACRAVVGLPVVPFHLRGGSGDAVRRFVFAYGVKVMSLSGVRVIALCDESYSSSFAREGIQFFKGKKTRRDEQDWKRAVDAVSCDYFVFCSDVFFLCGMYLCFTN